MNKVSIAVFAGCVATAGAWLLVHEKDTHVRKPPAAASAVAATVSALPVEAAVEAAAATVVPEAGAVPSGVASASEASLPELPDAPKSLRFGVVLVTYAGAERTPKDARSREEAEAKAKKLAVLAADDFKAAVAAGDKGSFEDAGRMFRGILEPDVDYAMFALEKGATSQPVDTPRGFWIIKRID